jgi:hypothetical protein
MILKEAPAGARVLDLDAARVARAEASKDAPSPVVKLSVGFVTLQKELDVLCGEDFAAGNARSGLLRILADPKDIDALGSVTRDDLEAIVNFVSGKSLGE